VTKKVKPEEVSRAAGRVRCVRRGTTFLLLYILVFATSHENRRGEMSSAVDVPLFFAPLERCGCAFATLSRACVSAAKLPTPAPLATGQHDARRALLRDRVVCGGTVSAAGRHNGRRKDGHVSLASTLTPPCAAKKTN